MERRVPSRRAGRSREDADSTRRIGVRVGWTIAALVALAVAVVLGRSHAEYPQWIWCSQPVASGPAPGAPLVTPPDPCAEPGAFSLWFADRCWWAYDAAQRPLLLVSRNSQSSAVVRFVVGMEPMTGVEANYQLTDATLVVRGRTWVRLRRTFPP